MGGRVLTETGTVDHHTSFGHCRYGGGQRNGQSDGGLLFISPCAAAAAESKFVFVFPEIPTTARASSAVIGAAAAAADDDARSDATSLDRRRSSDHHAFTCRCSRSRRGRYHYHGTRTKIVENQSSPTPRRRSRRCRLIGRTENDEYRRRKRRSVLRARVWLLFRIVLAPQTSHHRRSRS